MDQQSLSILNRPLFPSSERIGQALSDFRDYFNQTFIDPSIPPMMMAGSAGVNPSRIGPPPPLFNTRRFDLGPPSERPDWRDPSQQWDVRKTRTPSSTGSGRTISQADAIAQNNADMSPQEQEFYRDYMGRMYTPQAPPPRAVDMGIPGFTTPYGMVYPTRSQVGDARRLSELRPMSARLANIGEKIVRPKVLKSRIDYVKNSPTSNTDGSTMSKALEGLTQEEKIRVMRERGKQLAKQRKEDTEKFFASKQSERKQETEKIQKSAERTARNTRGEEQTRQRSWSNYVGKKPIRNFEYGDA